MRFLLASIIVLSLAATPAAAITNIGGAQFEDRVTVDGSELVLNGAGVRTRAFFKVYAIGLYVTQRSTDPTALLMDKGAKRMRLVVLRNVAAEAFADALVEGIKRNHSPAAMNALKPGIDTFYQTLLALKEAKKGSVVDLDNVSGGGVRLRVNDEKKGNDVTSGELYPALLRIWIGEKPAQQDLKEALLGKGQQ